MKLVLAIAFALLMPVAALAAGAPADGQKATDAARSWLVLIDNGRYADSWTGASALFKQRVSQEQWVGMVKPIRESFGATVSRTPEGAEMKTSLPGAPDGRYAIVRFKAKFAKKAEATETVTMMLDGNAWKAAGYFIN